MEFLLFKTKKTENLEEELKLLTIYWQVSINVITHFNDSDGINEKYHKNHKCYCFEIKRTFKLYKFSSSVYPLQSLYMGYIAYTSIMHTGIFLESLCMGLKSDPIPNAKRCMFCSKLSLNIPNRKIVNYWFKK